MPSTSHLSSSCICSCATSKCVRSTGGEHTSEYLCRLLRLGLKVESSMSKILYHLSPRGGYLPRCFPPRSPAPQMPIADQLHHHPEMKGASRETWSAPYAQACPSLFIQVYRNEIVYLDTVGVPFQRSFPQWYQSAQGSPPNSPAFKPVMSNALSFKSCQHRDAEALQKLCREWSTEMGCRWLSMAVGKYQEWPGDSLRPHEAERPRGSPTLCLAITPPLCNDSLKSSISSFFTTWTKEETDKSI